MMKVELDRYGVPIELRDEGVAGFGPAKAPTWIGNELLGVDPARAEFLRGTTMSEAEGLVWCVYAQATRLRRCVIELPYDQALPAWAMAGVFAAAPPATLFDGTIEWRQFASNAVLLRFRALSFPRWEPESPKPMPSVTAAWDFERRVAKVEWPRREDYRA